LPREPTIKDRPVTRPLPDVVGPGLAVLFVGINPGWASARAGHHFANPANGFWRLLHEAGFTPRQFAPSEDRRLPELGLGVTNLVARASAGSSDLGREELLAGAEKLGRTLERWRPKAVVFVGLTAWAAFARRFSLAPGATRAECGGFADARLFVVPNPSGRNAHFSRAQMRTRYRRVARALGFA
jgi:TDG/mug DNA glycosylase family protein